MIGILAGLAYANAIEWAFHKYVLHEIGRKKSNFWSFHWSEHHKNCRKHDMHDPAYQSSLLEWNAQSKEVAALALGVAIHLPLLPVAPLFTLTIGYSAVDYYFKHKKSHIDPEWSKTYLPWHYDHHMGPDQDANWGVTHPWFDYVFGTRKEYLGTEEEKRKIERLNAKLAT
ncbi:MAG: sterol desaturase family protein [Leptospiraceae bacterium]|nr:sterol desaturase family protein [Leptospiraceae bacterium]MCP5497971.1 sterol desaturase family protein [Leptospiraceae bacterium]